MPQTTRPPRSLIDHVHGILVGDLEFDIEKKDTAWNFTTHMGATREFFHNPALYFEKSSMAKFLF